MVRYLETPKTWVEMLEVCRNKDKTTLAYMGRKFAPLKQDCISDNELIKQIASLGSFDHPLFEDLLGEAHRRWSQLDSSAS